MGNGTARGGAMKHLSAIILVAGKGTRMKSDLPKVAHEVAGRAMVLWVARACARAGCGRVIVVVGHGREIVRGIFEGWDEAGTTIDFAVQDPQHGTGHAVQCAREALGDEGGDVFVLAGDGPLIRASTLERLFERHDTSGAAATLATARLADPTGYGRIVRDGEGRFEGIVEHKNCTDEQRAIDEVNPSYYCFDAARMFDALDRVGWDEKSGELFLTDAVGLLAGEAGGVELIEAVSAEDVLSINTPEQLAEVDRVLREREGAAGAAGRAG